MLSVMPSRVEDTADPSSLAVLSRGRSRRCTPGELVLLAVRLCGRIVGLHDAV